MLMGPFFGTRIKENFLKKLNSMKGLASLHFLYIKRPFNVESHVYKVTKKNLVEIQNVTAIE